MRENKGALPPWLGAALAVVLLYGGMEALGVTCPIRFFTGISCAGCGMSRAYPPLFWTPVLAAGLFLFRRQIPRRVLRGAVWAGAVLFLAVYALRMADPGDSIVTFAPQTGFLFRVVFGA